MVIRSLRQSCRPALTNHKARIEQLMLEMLQLRQVRSSVRLKHQAIQMNGSPKVGCLSDVPKASSCTSSPSKAKPELAELLAVDSPGIYVVSQLVSLTVGPEKGSPKLQMISVGTTVQVLEVLHRQGRLVVLFLVHLGLARPEDRRVRGRIEEPAGWISIVSTEDVGQSCDLELSQSRQQLEAARAEAAEDLGRRERELHELRERLRSLELQLHQAQLQCDGPGVYILAGEVDVTEAVGRGSTKVGRLQPGQEVHVLEVVQKEQDRRVRARIQQPAGWISLLDTSEGHRWAHRQLAATNEWISELSSGGELELKARLAALEAGSNHSLSLSAPVVPWPEEELQRRVEECVSERLRDLEQRLALLEQDARTKDARVEGELRSSVLRASEAFLSVQPPPPVPRLPFSRHEQLELSTAPEKTVDEKGCAAEYRFEACVWDSSVLVGLGVLSWQESLSVVLCGLWSVLVEGFFVLILCDNMTDTVFEDSLAQEMKEWRVQFGQNLNYVDAATGQPLIMGVCSMSNSLLNGVVQAEIYETMFKYGIREAGNEDLRWPLLPVGAWLALIALLVWIFTVIKDILSTPQRRWEDMLCAFSFGIALTSLPSGDTTHRSGQTLLSGVSRLRMLLLFVLNILPRLCIALVLGIIGVHFLASTTSTVKSLKPLPVTLRTPFLHARQGLIFMLSLASLAAAHVVYLQPVVDNMQMTADALCAGVTNFTTFQDAAGLVFLLDGPAPPADDHSSYAYRAVLQATGLEEVHPEPLAARVQNAALRGLAMQLKSMTFEERNEFWPLCRDMDSEVYEGFGLMHMRSATAENLNRLFPDADLAGLERSCWSFRRSAALMVVQISPAFLLRLPEQVACSGMILSFRVHVGTFTVEDAALFRHRFQHKLPHPYDPEGNYCFNGTLPLQSLWHLRALCPVTCGCASLEGSFVANLPSFGCPQVCKSVFQRSDSIFKRYTRGLAQRKGFVGNVSRCSDFAVPVVIDGSPFNFCTQSSELRKMGFQSAELLCPETCACSSSPSLESVSCSPPCQAHRDSLLAELNGNAAGSAVTGDVDVLELQELQAKVLLLEAGREEVELQAELMRTKYAALEAEHQDCLPTEDAALQVARGWSLQAEELQRQVNQQVQERGRLEAELARLRAEHGALAETPMVAESPLSQAERWVLYTEIPKVEAASSQGLKKKRHREVTKQLLQCSGLTYFGQVQMDFDREELCAFLIFCWCGGSRKVHGERLGLGFGCILGQHEEFVAPLAPLAAVNLAHRAAATAALERGDVARVALKRKRALDSGEEVPLRSDELRPPDELPEREAAAVRVALERWQELRLRAEVLRPMLEHEDRLMQDILDRGLGSEDRKTLRKLASVGARDAEAEAAQVAESVGQERQRLQEILMQNHRELLELSTTTTPDDKKELIAEMDGVLDELKKAQDAVHVFGELPLHQCTSLRVSVVQDMCAVRAYGRSLNDLKALTRRLDCERRSLTKNSVLATLLVTVCRRILPVRQINPSELTNIPASYEGYLQILDFYFFSDASLYCFGEHFSGPNWFTRLKRNVAILSVSDADGNCVYNNFAVSGEYKTPGAPLAPDGGPLHDGWRESNAFFKLLTGLCGAVPAEKRPTWSASATLWSKKPLCRSCAGAVSQVEGLFPRMSVAIVVGEPKTEEDGSEVPNGKRLKVNGFRVEPSRVPWAK
eukprot:g10109.t1